MTVTTTAHANFRGQAREALTFYQSVFGGDLSLATYADIHAAESPDVAEHIAFLKGGSFRYVGTPWGVFDSKDPDVQEFFALEAHRK